MTKQQSKHNPSQSKKYTGKKQTLSKTNIGLLLPLIFILTIFPFIVRYYDYDTPLSKFPWFTVSSKYTDFFLYYKQFYFILIAAIMLLILLSKGLIQKTKLPFLPIFIPLAIYGLMAFLSSVISKYRNYSFTGVFGQFESVFALLGYCIIVYYVVSIVNYESDITLLLNCVLFSVLILSLIGLTQILGHDFYATELGRRLITPRSLWNNLNTIDFTFGQEWVYMTFFNPNYAAVFSSFIAPIFFILMLFTKDLWKKILYIVVTIFLLICLIGSQTTAGYIGLMAAAFVAIIIFHKYLFKYYFISGPIIILTIIGALIFNGVNNNILMNKITQVFHIQKTTAALTDIQTNDDNLKVIYKGNTLKLTFNVSTNNKYVFTFVDQFNKPIKYDYNPKDGGVYTITDSRYPGFVISPCIYNKTISFNILIDGKQWFFTNQTDGTYYYYNHYARLDKIVTAPSAVFTGYESIATRRGYIWSRSIPLLKDYLFLGSGANTFIVVFPQQDYVNINNYSYSDQLLTKPHNLYLQIGIQTGVVSLIAFLVFYIMYFISSIRLYIKGKFSNYYSQVGVAILIGTFSYMITGLTNDSSITVAPIFWLFIGLGIAVNSKAKHLYEIEISEKH